MAIKHWYADGVTTEADLVAPAASKEVAISTLYVTNAGTSTAAVVVKLTSSANALRATLAKQNVAPGGTLVLTGLCITANATPDKIRVSSDNAVSCAAFGDQAA